jgi:AcrR family transcriptional regulator
LIERGEEKLARQSRGAGTRQERAHRILDAASTLIQRWGYNKTTIDDIARQAGVAKGTIYLHWKTREELFTALLTREKLEMGTEIRQSIVDDPEGATLRGMMKHMARILMKRPLLKAIFLHDMEILGKLTQERYSTEAHRQRLAGFNAYLELLREHNLVRKDLSLQAQVYIFSAIFTGFFLAQPFMAEDYPLSDEEIADLMAETVHQTLEPDHPIAPDSLAAASEMFLRYLDHSLANAQKELQQEIDE